MPRAKPYETFTERGKLMYSTTPRPNTRAYSKHGASKAPKIAEVRARGTDTSNLTQQEMNELIRPDKPLTEKQKLFVKFWAEGDSIQSAGRRAGYGSSAIPYTMTKMPHIMAVKTRLSKEYEDAVHMTKKRVMEMFLESYEMAKLMAEPATMVAAAREVGKMCGYYAPVEHRVRVDVLGNVILDRMNSLSDAELLKVIADGTKETILPLLECVTDDLHCQ